MDWDGPLSWPIPDRLSLLAIAALALIALVRAANLAALPCIAILLFTRLRPFTVGQVAALVLALIALLLSAGTLTLIPLLVALVVCHGQSPWWRHGHARRLSDSLPANQ